jgi:hypothetical protein
MLNDAAREAAIGGAIFSIHGGDDGFQICFGNAVLADQQTHQGGDVKFQFRILGDELADLLVLGVILTIDVGQLLSDLRAMSFSVSAMSKRLPMSPKNNVLAQPIMVPFDLLRIPPEFTSPRPSPQRGEGELRMC